MANDAWFRGLELKYGPDGAVYLTDWYDTGECHETDADNAHRENGRIYTVRYGCRTPSRLTFPPRTTKRWRGCSFIATTGTSVLPAGFCKSAPPQGKT